MCALLICPASLMAGPVEGQVVAGQADINQSGLVTNIDQSTQRAIVNWKSFDINSNEAVRHNMPNPNSAALHRVTGGGGASQLAGELSSNGNIFLVNPAGVVINKGARIDTGGFVASTRDISNENFMDGNLLFDKPGHPEAQIINQGQINVRESGLAALVAPAVRNEGIIAARLGRVALASGDSAYKLDMYGDDLINFTVEENKVDQLYSTDGHQLGIENTGTIKAEGGVVLLSATQLDGIVSSVVNNSGAVVADSAEATGGRIIFKGQGENVGVVNIGTVSASSETGDGGSVRIVADGSVSVSGVVEAKGKNKGGQIDISGEKETVFTNAKITADGAKGGLIRLGGEFQGGKNKLPELYNNFLGNFDNLEELASTSNLFIDSSTKINPGVEGTLIAWSDGITVIDGILSGKNIETSGKKISINSSPQVSKHGTLLIDPTYVLIGAGTEYDGTDPDFTTIGNKWIENYLNVNDYLTLYIYAQEWLRVGADIQYHNGTLFLVANEVSILANRNINGDDNSGLMLSGTTINIGNNSTITAGSYINIGDTFDQNHVNTFAINIGDNTTIKVYNGELNFFGKQLTIGKNGTIESNGDNGRINFWGALEDDDSVYDPFNSIYIDSGTKIQSKVGIDLYALYLTMYGASISTTSHDHGWMEFSKGRQVTRSVQEGNTYTIFEYDSIPGLSLRLLDDSYGNISTIYTYFPQPEQITHNSDFEFPGISLAVSNIEFGEKIATRIKSVAINLQAGDGKTLTIQPGTLDYPQILAYTVDFYGNNSVFKLNDYSLKTADFEIIGNNNRFEGNSNSIPDMFGIYEEYNVIYEKLFPKEFRVNDWERYVEFVEKFLAQNTTLTLGNELGKIWHETKTTKVDDNNSDNDRDIVITKPPMQRIVKLPKTPNVKNYSEYDTVNTYLTYNSTITNLWDDIFKTSKYMRDQNKESKQIETILNGINDGVNILSNITDIYKSLGSFSNFINSGDYWNALYHAKEIFKKMQEIDDVFTDSAFNDFMKQVIELDDATQIAGLLANSQYASGFDKLWDSIKDGLVGIGINLTVLGVNAVENFGRFVYNGTVPLAAYQLNNIYFNGKKVIDYDNTDLGSQFTTNESAIKDMSLVDLQNTVQAMKLLYFNNDNSFRYDEAFTKEDAEDVYGFAASQVINLWLEMHKDSLPKVVDGIFSKPKIVIPDKKLITG
jgi:filamentous hemagglutinin family protein